MQRNLSDVDRANVAMLKEFGMFQDIAPDKLEVGSGVIIACCSDGHQFDDLYKHIARVCKQSVSIDCIHPVALNGGAMLMGCKKDDNIMFEKQLRHGNVMRENIVDACAIKRVGKVFLYTHFPCAVAVANGLSIVDQGLYLMKAKESLKAQDGDLTVRCFFHIDMYDERENGEHKRRTYFMPREMWGEAAIDRLLHKVKEMLWK
jgi:hypothetical protein